MILLKYHTGDDVMEEFGGHAKYSDLYEKVKEMNLRDYSKIKSIEEQVRGKIQSYSSDLTVYTHKKGDPEKDLFYSVGGLRSGHWGLINYEPIENNVDITEDDEGFEEGKRMLRNHVCRERNYQVIKEAKERLQKGKLICQICEFNFEIRYGEIGVDYIEGHHIIPVSELEEGAKTKIEDIVLVCSNCHKMLHRRRPWLKVGELKELLIER